MTKRIGLVHSVIPAIRAVEDAFEKLWPAARTTSIYDQSTYQDLGPNRSLTPEIYRRIAALLRYSADCGVDAILVTGSLFGPAVADGELWRIVSSGFVHTGLLHLGFNMYALYMFGPPLERLLGPVRFVLAYLAGLLGDLLQELVEVLGSRKVVAPFLLEGLEVRLGIAAADEQRDGLARIVIGRLEESRHRNRSSAFDHFAVFAIKPARGIDDFRPPAVVQRDIEEHSGAPRRPLGRSVEFILDVGRQFLDPSLQLA